MAKSQDIQIALDDASLVALKNLGYALYVLQAVNTNNAGAKALVWSATTNFSNETSIAPAAAYQAYVDLGGTVKVSLGADVALGDVYTYVPGTPPQVAPGGYARGVTVLNGSTEPLTTGLRGGLGGQFLPFVSAPLYGLGGDIFAPRNVFLATFTTAGLNAGDVLTTSMTQGLLIDMTGQDHVAVSFDINKGWSYGDAAWGQIVRTGANLQKVLVQTMPMARSA